VKSGSKKPQKNNFVTSSINISAHEAASPLNKTGDISQELKGNRCHYNHTVEDMENVDSLDHSLV
jgi:hypothetical protein